MPQYGSKNEIPFPPKYNNKKLSPSTPRPPPCPSKNVSPTGVFQSRFVYKVFAPAPDTAPPKAQKNSGNTHRWGGVGAQKGLLQIGRIIGFKVRVSAFQLCKHFSPAIKKINRNGEGKGERNNICK